MSPSEAVRLAAQRLMEAQRAADLAELNLTAFDAAYAGSTFRSKDHRRHELQAEFAQATVAQMEALHAYQRVHEAEWEAARVAGTAAEAAFARPATTLGTDSLPETRADGALGRNDRGYPNREQIEAERALRMDRGDKIYGDGTLARHFGVNESTIRRRLGRLPK